VCRHLKIAGRIALFTISSGYHPTDRQSCNTSVQAGLTMRRVTLREIFSSTTIFLVWKTVTCEVVYFVISATANDTRVPVSGVATLDDRSIATR
jgi:hypothetical protein